MIDQETLRKLREMKLTGMADAFEELLGRAPSHEMTLAEQLGVLVEREWSDRDNRRLGRLLKAAKIGSDACREDVRCDPGRGLDHVVVRDLATGRWIINKLNVIVVGKTGVGKSYLGASAIGRSSPGCRDSATILRSPAPMVRIALRSRDSLASTSWSSTISCSRR